MLLMPLQWKFIIQNMLAMLEFAGSCKKREYRYLPRPVEDVLRNVSKYSGAVRNNGGGHYNHELFWKSMSPNGGNLPSGKLADAIIAASVHSKPLKRSFLMQVKIVLEAVGHGYISIQIKS